MAGSTVEPRDRDRYAQPQLAGVTTCFAEWDCITESRHLGIFRWLSLSLCRGDCTLGVHLHSATKDEIWQDDYVDLFSLLFRNPEPVSWAACVAVVHELEQFKHPTVESVQLE